MASAGQVIIDLLARDLTGPGVSGASKAMQKLQQKLERAASSARWAALGAGGAIAVAVNQAASFESQMSKVATVLDEAGMRHLPALSQAIRAMSVEFGQSTETLTQGLYDVISAGFSASEAVDLLRVANMAAVGGATDTATAVDGLTSALNAYALGADRATEVSDRLVATANFGKLDFADVARNIGRIAPTAKVACMEMESLLAAFSAISKPGMKADEAATLLLNLITKIVRPTDEAAAAAKEFGIELNGQAIAGERLYETMSKLQGFSVDQLMKIFPDTQAAQAAAILSGNMKAFGDALQAVKNNQGSTLQNFSKRAGDTSLKLAQLKQTANDLAIELGVQLAPVVTVAADKIREVLPEIKAWVSENGALIINLVEVGGAVAGVLLVLPKLVAGAQSVVTVGGLFVQAGQLMVTQLGMTGTATMTLATGAIALLVAMVIQVTDGHKTWEQAA